MLIVLGKDFVLFFIFSSLILPLLDKINSVSPVYGVNYHFCLAFP